MVDQLTGIGTISSKNSYEYSKNECLIPFKLPCVVYQRLLQRCPKTGKEASKSAHICCIFTSMESFQFVTIWAESHGIQRPPAL